MKKYSILFLTISFLLAAACSHKDGVLSFKLDTPFELKPGDSATLEDNPAVKIQFHQVLEDSRCPIDVECVWAGRAAVEISFTQGENTETNVLVIGDKSGTSYTEKAVFGNYTATLKALKPLPKAMESIEPGQYVAELEVSK